VYDEDETMILMAPCIVCGNLFASNPHTVPSVWINDETRCPVRPDGTPINPGEPGTHPEPLCNLCAPVVRAAVGRRIPVAKLFPRARLHRIAPPATGADL